MFRVHRSPLLKRDMDLTVCVAFYAFSTFRSIIYKDALFIMHKFDKIINHFKKKFDPSRIPYSVWNRAYKRYDTSVYENIEFVINPKIHQINFDAIFENTTPNQQTVYPFYEACANFIRRFGAKRWQFIPITNNGIHSLKL